MKKICLVIHSLGIGGMERVMSILAEDFAKRPNVEIHLVLIGIKRQIDYSIPDSVNVHKPGFRFENKRRTIDTVRTILFLRQKIKQISPDTLLSFGEMWNNLVLISTYGLNYPVFISDRSQPEKDLGKLHNHLRDKLYPKATGYVAQTGKAAEICSANGWNRNIEVIGNPIREIENGRETEKENLLLFVGRLIPSKHVDRLIRIFAKIDLPGWRLEIVGGDAKGLQLSDAYRELTDELGMDDRISLVGEQKNVDIYYRRARIFAFPSSSEGFPNVIGEAMSASLPVVAYDCVAGPSDMIDHGKNGYLVPLFDDDKFEGYLEKLMIEDDLRKEMAENCYMIREKFNATVIAEQYYGFIMSAVN